MGASKLDPYHSPRTSDIYGTLGFPELGDENMDVTSLLRGSPKSLCWPPPRRSTQFLHLAPHNAEPLPGCRESPSRERWTSCRNQRAPRPSALFLPSPWTSLSYTQNISATATRHNSFCLALRGYSRIPQSLVSLPVTIKAYCCSYCLWYLLIQCRQYKAFSQSYAMLGWRVRLQAFPAILEPTTGDDNGFVNLNAADIPEQPPNSDLLPQPANRCGSEICRGAGVQLGLARQLRGRPIKPYPRVAHKLRMGATSSSLSLPESRDEEEGPGIPSDESATTPSIPDAKNTDSRDPATNTNTVTLSSIPISHPLLHILPDCCRWSGLICQGQEWLLCRRHCHCRYQATTPEKPTPPRSRPRARADEVLAAYKGGGMDPQQALAYAGHQSWWASEGTYSLRTCQSVEERTLNKSSPMVARGTRRGQQIHAPVRLASTCRSPIIVG